MLPSPDAAEDNPATTEGAKAEGSFPSSGRHDFEPPAFFKPGKVDSQEHISPWDRIFPPPRDIYFGSTEGYADPHVSQPRTDRISPFDSATSFKAGPNECTTSHEHRLAGPKTFSGASEAKFSSILFSAERIVFLRSTAPRFFFLGRTKCPPSHEHRLTGPTTYSGASEAKFRSILFSSSFIYITYIFFGTCATNHVVLFWQSLFPPSFFCSGLFPTVYSGYIFRVRGTVPLGRS